MKYVKFLLILSCLLFSYPVYGFESDFVRTTLVLIEETENGKSIEGREPGLNQPFADGLYEALWDFEGVFFDSVPSSKFRFEDDGTICAIPFIREAQGYGADSLLLIKVNYSTSLSYSKLNIKLDDLRYNLYSIYEDRSVSNGDLSGKYQNTTERVKQITYLKNLGRQLLKIIYSDAQ